MPGFFYAPMTRKTFLKTTATAAGAMLLAPTTNVAFAAHSQAESLRVALLSDTHIPTDANNEYRGFRPVENLKQVLPQVIAAKPDMAILTGDAARLTGQETDYRALKQLLSPLAAQTPIHIGLGNHDDRSNFFKVFPAQNDKDATVDGKHVTSIDTEAVRYIVLDSLQYVDKASGLLGLAQRRWLTQTLENSDDRPTVLFVHHTLGEGDGDLLDVDRMFRILKPHPKVKAIFFGHSHHYGIDVRQNVHLINLPAVGYNFNDREPVGWIDARFSPAGVQLTLHAIGGNRDGDGESKSVKWA